MATYKVNGIILRRKNFFEADRIVTIFSKYLGKVIFIAKGSRKILSRCGGHLEPFFLCNFILAEGKNFDILTSIEIIESFKSISRDLQKTALAYKICELTDHVMVEKQENHQVYDLLHQSLEYIDKNTLKERNLIFEYYALKILSLIGFISKLDNCLDCENKLKEEINYLGFEGGVLCPTCGKSGKMILEVKPKIIKLIKLFLASDIEVLNRINTGQIDVDLFKKVVNIYLQNVLEKELNSEKFFKKVGSSRTS